MSAASSASGQVVLSEIMFNPLGSESHDEFIEIVNLSEAEAVDLMGWRISDGSSTDDLAAHERGLVLQPGQFGLVLDATYFNNSTSYDDFIPDNALILTIDNSAFGLRGLANETPEIVSLLDASGRVVSVYTYTTPNAGGFPDEKIDLFGSDVPDNWQDGKVVLGTPGGTNSTTLQGFAPSSVRVNEIMYSPLDGQPEWIEIINTLPTTIDLTRWAVTDSDTRARVFILDRVFLAPEAFLVLVADSSILEVFSPSPRSLVELKALPSLNDDFDSVVALDLLGQQIDRVDYRKSWGGARGISLEKIRPDLASGDSSNWSSSVTFLGGTPGARNSIFAETVVAGGRISITPNPFSPDGDGKDDFVLIGYELPMTTASVNVKIYDLRGRLIRFLANNRPAASQNTIVWDGTDSHGEIARMGIYIVFLQALNAQAGVLETQKKTLVLAGKL
ncbi:MAG: lamin tail domain-containing protein [bacterium]